MSKNKPSDNYSPWTRSIVAVSLTSVGLISVPFVTPKLTVGSVPLQIQPVHADGLPDLSDITYTNGAFQSSTGRWTRLSGNSTISVFSGSTINVNGEAAFTSATTVVAMFKLPSAPADSNFKVASPTGQTLMSGTLQKVTLQGQTYYAAFVPSGIVQTMIQQLLDHGTVYRLYQSSVIAPNIPIRAVQKTASLSLPAVSQTVDGKNASTAVIGKSVAVLDDQQKQLTTVTLKKEWLAVTNDQSTAGSYSYTLNSTGIQAIQKELDQLTNAHAQLSYQLQTPTSANITLKAKVSTPAELTVTYLDQSTGKKISTKKIQGAEQSTEQYQVVVPKGYQLATGQSQTLDYRLTSDTSDNLTVKLTPVTETSSSSSTTSSSASSSGSKKTSSRASSQSSVRSVASSARSSSRKKPVAHAQGIATVALVNEDTGQIVSSKIFSGFVGYRIPLDLHESMIDLLRSGYRIVQNDTENPLYFTDQPTTYYIRFQSLSTPSFAAESAEKSDANSSTAAPAPSTSDAPAATRSKIVGALEQTPPATQSTRSRKTTPDSGRRTTNRLAHRSGIAPAIFEEEPFAHFFEGGSGGGDGHGDVGLGSYFTAIAGTVNFSQP